MKVNELNIPQIAVPEANESPTFFSSHIQKFQQRWVEKLLTSKLSTSQFWNENIYPFPHFDIKNIRDISIPTIHPRFLPPTPHIM